MKQPNLTFNYAFLLRQVKERVATAQKKAIYAANEEMSLISQFFIKDRIKSLLRY